MIKNFNISDLEFALKCYATAFPERTVISDNELIRIYKFVLKPPVYNIDIIIQSLSDYINSDYYERDELYSESQLCKIIGVKKLTLHEWRTNEYINFRRYPASRTVRYDLPLLLKDLKNLKSKTYQFLLKGCKKSQIIANNIWAKKQNNAI